MESNAVIHETDATFAVFVHYTLRDDELKDPNAGPLKRRLLDDLRFLDDVILKPERGRKGFAFVFIDRGWADLLHEKDLLRLGAELGVLRKVFHHLNVRRLLRC